MLEDPLGRVNAGLRKATRVIAAYLAMGASLGFARTYAELVFDPSFSVLWVYGYLVFAAALIVAAIWYQAYRANPRILTFVRTFSGRIREAAYAAWGVKKSGLVLGFDNGLILNVRRSFLSFRLLLAPDGSVLRPTLKESFAGGSLGAKRRGYVSSREGSTWQRAELERVRDLLRGRSAVLVLFERPTSETPNPSPRRWTCVGLFSIPRWWQRGDAIRNALDDIERLLEQLPTSLTL